MRFKSLFSIIFLYLMSFCGLSAQYQLSVQQNLGLLYSTSFSVSDIDNEFIQAGAVNNETSFYASTELRLSIPLGKKELFFYHIGGLYTQTSYNQTASVSREQGFTWRSIHYDLTRFFDYAGVSTGLTIVPFQNENHRLHVDPTYSYSLVLGGHVDVQRSLTNIFSNQTEESVIQIEESAIHGFSREHVVKTAAQEFRNLQQVSIGAHYSYKVWNNFWVSAGLQYTYGWGGLFIDTDHWMAFILPPDDPLPYVDYVSPVKKVYFNALAINFGLNYNF